MSEPKKVDLGENKVISTLTFEHDGSKMQLGAVILLPSSYDRATDKTYYKPIGIKSPITLEQRDAIIKMLGGIPQ